MQRIYIIIFICFNFFSHLAFAKDEKIPVDDIQNFVSVYNLLKTQYVDEVSSDQLIQNAIKGMITELDPHSSYIQKNKIKKFDKALTGEYKGFGISITKQNKKIIIIAPIAESPAEKAGLLAGDEIVKINQTLTKDLSIDDVGKLLENSDKEAEITIYRKSKNKTLNIKVSRGDIHLPSVFSKMISQYAYIRISQFVPTTAEEFTQKWQTLKAQKPKGLIIDLRNNPGGLVRSATDIADQFLKGGLIVSTKNNQTGHEEKTYASKDIYDDIALLILINHGSASASELLAGALQDHHRAMIVGEKSFGKGSVQTIINLANGDAVKFTTARYYTPNKHSIQAKGISPDFLLSPLQVKTKKESLLDFHEADYQNHLSASPEKEKNSSTEISAELAKKDFQLYEALVIFQASEYRASIPKK